MDVVAAARVVVVHVASTVEGAAADVVLVEDVVLATEPYSSFCGSCAQSLLIGNIESEVDEVEDEKVTKVERSCGCDGTIFYETRMQANLEPRRERVSWSCGPQSAHKDKHSVEIHKAGKRKRAHLRQIKALTTCGCL